MIKKHYFLLPAIAGRADKLENLILFQNCHLGTPRRAVISGKNLLGGVGSGNVQPLACGHAALKIWTKGHPVWFQAADLFRKTGSHWLCTQPIGTRQLQHPNPSPPQNVLLTSSGLYQRWLLHRWHRWVHAQHVGWWDGKEKLADFLSAACSSLSQSFFLDFQTHN